MPGVRRREEPLVPVLVPVLPLEGAWPASFPAHDLNALGVQKILCRGRQLRPWANLDLPFAS